MYRRDLICIGCPMGCHLEVTLENEQVASVKGQACKRGEAYGIKECTNPTRILTTTVEVENAYPPVVPVKTQFDIPKDKLFDCVKVLKKVRLTAPVHIGDIIIENILGTGVNIIATNNASVKK